jgi:hypothetical protein
MASLYERQRLSGVFQGLPFTRQEAASHLQRLPIVVENRLTNWCLFKSLLAVELRMHRSGFLATTYYSENTGCHDFWLETLF